MGFLDNVLDKAKTVTQTAGKKAGELVEITKLNLAISDLNSEIEKTLKEIGSLVYGTYKENTEISETIKEKCVLIDTKTAEIESIKIKINSIKNVKICPACGEANINESAFCAKCGAKLPETKAQDNDGAFGDDSQIGV